MTDYLKKHEQFEIEVLKLLSDNQLLNKVTFGGGTMMRLCIGLNRYSVDLDFFSKETFGKEDFKKIEKLIAGKYKVLDSYEKFYTRIVEFKSPAYPRKLKLEIRKFFPEDRFETDVKIAFSKFSNEQVRVTTFSDEQSWKNKVKAIMERREIRDAYDLEFMYKKGIGNWKALDPEKKIGILKILDAFSKNDFKVKLGSLLDKEERDYYNEFGFKILKNALT